MEASPAEMISACAGNGRFETAAPNDGQGRQGDLVPTDELANLRQAEPLQHVAQHIALPQTQIVGRCNRPTRYVCADEVIPIIVLCAIHCCFRIDMQLFTDLSL